MLRSQWSSHVSSMETGGFPQGPWLMVLDMKSLHAASILAVQCCLFNQIHLCQELRWTLTRSHFSRNRSREHTASEASHNGGPCLHRQGFVVWFCWGHLSHPAWCESHLDCYYKYIVCDFTFSIWKLIQS